MFVKKITTGNMYIDSIRKGIIKELCGIYKVFLLLNECGDPPFLVQNLSSLKVTNHRQSLVENLCSVRGNDLKSALMAV